jgi:hypothetical protein
MTTTARPTRSAGLRGGLGKPRQTAASPTTVKRTEPVGPVEKVVGPAPLVPRSITAKALARVWSGGECTVVDSPPGGGKTELVVTVIAHLATRTDMTILVATPTKAQASALTERLATQMSRTSIHTEIKGTTSPYVKVSGSQPSVTITTLAKCRFIDRTSYDLIVVDEAYQATHADVKSASAGIAQKLLVGDPGQIGPVVTVDTSIWIGQKDAPHLQAPAVARLSKDAERFFIDRTWRLGPDSARMVAPIYDFEFHSVGIPRSAVTRGGEMLSEIEAIAVPRASEVDDLTALATVADRVAELMDSEIRGPEGVRSADDADIAVVVSRNSQVAILTGMLRQRGLAPVIGTADRLQGGEWPIVVALDPMLGVQEGQSEHNSSLGRLCVMVSRHNTHLTWVHDDGWVETMAGKRSPDVVRGRKVRKLLTGAATQDAAAIS